MTVELGGSRSLRCLAGGLCRGAGQGRVPWPCRESSEEEEEDRERERAPEGKTFLLGGVSQYIATQSEGKMQ